MEKVGSDQNDRLGAVREAAVFAASVHQLLVTEWTVTAFGVSKTAVLHFTVQAVFFCYIDFECISEYVFNREGRLQKFRDPVQESAKRAAVFTGRSLDRNRTGEIIFVQV